MCKMRYTVQSIRCMDCTKLIIVQRSIKHVVKLAASHGISAKAELVFILNTKFKASKMCLIVNLTSGSHEHHCRHHHCMFPHHDHFHQQPSSCRQLNRLMRYLAFFKNKNTAASKKIWSLWVKKNTDMLTIQNYIKSHMLH